MVDMQDRINRLVKFSTADMALRAGRPDVCRKIIAEIDDRLKLALPLDSKGMNDFMQSHIIDLSRVILRDMTNLLSFKPRKAREVLAYAISEIYKDVEDLDTRLKF